MRRRALLVLSALGFLAVSGCQQDASTGVFPAPTGCQAGTARIAVGDGYFQILCGCQEALGTSSGPGSVLTCTVPAGTGIVFTADQIQLRHQIISAGGLSIDPTPIFDPDGDDIQNYVVQTGAAGTYLFEDAFDPALSGQIVAH